MSSEVLLIIPNTFRCREQFVTTVARLRILGLPRGDIPDNAEDLNAVLSWVAGFSGAGKHLLDYHLGVLRWLRENNMQITYYGGNPPRYELCRRVIYEWKPPWGGIHL